MAQGETITEAIQKRLDARRNRVMTSEEYSSHGKYDGPTWNMRLVGACPHCKEHDIDIEAKRFEEHGTWGILPVSCRRCGAAWDMRFVLDGFEWEGEDGKYDIEKEEG